MSYTVRRHERLTASGKTATVREHERQNPGSGESPYVQDGDDFYEVQPDGTRQRLDPPGWWNAATSDEDWQDAEGGDPDDLEATSDLPEDTPEPAPAPRSGDRAFPAMQAEMRDWRSRPVPQAAPGKPMTPELAALLGCDTPGGLATYERGRAYREAGYNGPLDADNRIPDPDDPAEYEALHALAALSEI